MEIATGPVIVVIHVQYFDRSAPSDRNLSDRNLISRCVQGFQEALELEKFRKWSGNAEASLQNGLIGDHQDHAQGADHG